LLDVQKKRKKRL